MANNPTPSIHTSSVQYYNGLIKPLGPSKLKNYCKIHSLAVAILRVLVIFYKSCVDLFEKLMALQPFLLFASGLTFLVDLFYGYLTKLGEIIKKEKKSEKSSETQKDETDKIQIRKKSTKAMALRASKKTVDTASTTLISLVNVGINPLKTLQPLTRLPLLDLIMNPSIVIVNGISIYNTIDKLAHIQDENPNIQYQRTVLLSLRLTDKIFKLLKTCMSYASIFYMTQMAFIVANPYYLLAMVLIDCIFLFGYSMAKNVLNYQINEIKEIAKASLKENTTKFA
jgi:hypothetical protein